MMNEAFRERVRRETSDFHSFAGGDTPVEIGSNRVFVYPDFGTPDGLPDHTAHRFHVVRVMRRLGPDEIDEEVGAQFEVTADDGWRGQAAEEELFSFVPEADLALPEGLVIETDEDGPTQDGSIAVKRAFVELFQAAGYEADMPEEYRTLARFYPVEYGEVCEQFERAPAPAYR